MDGTGAGRARWEDWVRGRLNQQPQRVARELETLGLAQSLTRKGVPTWMGEAASVIDALRGGYAQEWLDQQGAESQQAKATAFPELGADEDAAAYEARVMAWADELPRGVVQRLAPQGLPDAIRERLQARTAVARRGLETRAKGIAAARRSALVEAIDRARPLEVLEEHLRQEQYIGADGMFVGIPGQDDLETLVRSSAQAWAAGRKVVARYSKVEPAGTPPLGWPAAHLDTVIRLAVSEDERAPLALAELVRRLPDGSVFETDYSTAALRQGEVVYFEGSTERGRPPEGVTRVSFVPGPDGWAEPFAHPVRGIRYRWASGRAFAALTRVVERARCPGSLDVRRVIGAYGRHPEKRFPRLSFSAYRSWLTVGVDDALGPIMDDLALVHVECPDRVPGDAYRIHAEVRKTQANGLQVVRRDHGERGALISVSGSAMSQGRHGWAGTTPAVKEGSSALSVSLYGGSRGGGQAAAVVVAVLTEGRPLLLDSGVGYRLGAQPGQVERVPGLAEGRPGEPASV